MATDAHRPLQFAKPLIILRPRLGKDSEIPEYSAPSSDWTVIFIGVVHDPRQFKKIERNLITEWLRGLYFQNAVMVEDLVLRRTRMSIFVIHDAVCPAESLERQISEDAYHDQCKIGDA